MRKCSCGKFIADVFWSDHQAHCDPEHEAPKRETEKNGLGPFHVVYNRDGSVYSTTIECPDCKKWVDIENWEAHLTVPCIPAPCMSAPNTENRPPPIFSEYFDGPFNQSIPGDWIEPDSEAPKERHGHPDFYKILDSLADLHSEKNHDYAAGGDPLGNFQRRADLYARYPGLDLSNTTVVALVDAMKQLDAALWFLSNGHTSKVEGLESRLRDVAVYAVLAIILNKEGANTGAGRNNSTDLHILVKANNSLKDHVAGLETHIETLHKQIATLENKRKEE